MTRRLPDDDSRPLDDAEQRSLDLIERSLEDDEPLLSRRLDGRRDRPKPPVATTRELAGGLTVAGFALTYIGIALDAVLLGFAGFILMLSGVDHLTRGVDGGRMVRRLVGRLRGDPRSAERD